MSQPFVRLRGLLRRGRERGSHVYPAALRDTRTAFQAQKQQAKLPQLDESLYNLQVADDSSPHGPRRLQPITAAFLQAEIEKTKQKMLAAAKALDFMEAANLRDYMLMLSEKLEHLKHSPS